MRRAHCIVGLVFVIVFLATGQYMGARVPEGFEEHVDMRLMYRSAHVYILLTALINLVLGAHLKSREARWRHWLQWVGSVLILLAPPLETVAFFVEPAPDTLERPLTQLAVGAALAGSLFHWISSLRD